MGLLSVLHLPEPRMPTQRIHARRSGKPGRRPGRVRKHGKAAPKLGVNQYIALIHGTVQLLADPQQLGSINVDPSDPKDLVAAHRDAALAAAGGAAPGSRLHPVKR